MWRVEYYTFLKGQKIEKIPLALARGFAPLILFIFLIFLALYSLLHFPIFLSL